MLTFLRFNWSWACVEITALRVFALVCRWNSVENRSMIVATGKIERWVIKTFLIYDFQIRKNFKPTQSRAISTNTISAFFRCSCDKKVWGAIAYRLDSRRTRNEGNNERRKRRERQETEEIKEVKHEKISQSWR
jgi:hypothetical protein